MTSNKKDTHHSKSSKKKSSSSSSKKSKRRSSSSAKMDPPPDLVELDEGSNSSHSHSASSSLDAPLSNSVVGPSHVAIVTILGRISSPTCTLSLSPKKTKKNGNKSRKSVRFSDSTQPQQDEEDISDIACQSHEFDKIQGDEAQKVWYNASEMRDMRREANLIVETLREDDDFLWATNVLYQTHSSRRSADKVKMDRAFKILAHHHDLARGLEMHLDPTPQRTMAEHLFVVDRAQRTADRALLRKESRKGSKRTAHYASAMAELDAQEAAVAYYNCSSSS